MTSQLSSPLSKLPTKQILTFWLGSSDHQMENEAKWWVQDDRWDRTVRDQFEAALIEWATIPFQIQHQDAYSSLAYIILFDQFPRNIYRDTPQAFAYDHLALTASLEGQKKGLDQELAPIERLFYYMPMEHSESLNIQEQSVRQFKSLYDTAPSSHQESMKLAYEYAIAHYEVIQRFGRFPHRNTILGRESTDDEKTYLEQPGSGF